MQSVRRRGQRVARATWRASGYTRNPRRRRRVTRARRRYRRNPGFSLSPRGILNGAIELGKAAGFTLIGGMVGSKVLPMIPGDVADPKLNAGLQWFKAALIGGLVKSFGSRYVGRENATYLALGIVLGPTKALITELAPTIGSQLGDGVMRLPSFPRGMLSSYPAMAHGGSGMASYPQMGDAGASGMEVWNQ